MWLVIAQLLAIVALVAGGAAATDYDVIVIGVGPVGSFLAQLLPSYGVKRVLAVEKHNRTFYSPRAVAWDDYTIRAARAVGRDLHDYMHWHAWSLDHRWHLKGCQSGLRSGRAATRWAIACDYERHDTRWRRNLMVTSGMPVSAFHQPNWEDEMRRRLGTLDGVTASFGTEVVRTRIVDGLCEVTTRPAYTSGPETTQRAHFCVGADGRNSQVRQQLGLGFNGTTFEDQPWIVVDTEVYDADYLKESWIGTEGTGFVMVGRDGPETVVNSKKLTCPFVFFPTPAFFNKWWEDANREAAGASTEEERRRIRDEALFRMRSETINTSHKADALPYPIGTAFRFEFLLQSDMDPSTATSKEFVDKLLVDCAEVDPKRLKIIRKVVYNFDARRASKWRVGPMFLVGDAAHCMPPFQGQGMNSGLRDAANLAWKIALVLKGFATESVLKTYEPERRTNLELVTQDSVHLGKDIMLDDPQGTLMRDIVIKVMMVGRWLFGFQYSYISDLPHIKSRWSLTKGELGGELMPCPEVSEEGFAFGGHRKLFLDDLSSGNGFTLVVCGGGGVDARQVQLPASKEALKYLNRLGSAVVAVAPREWRGKPPSSRVPVVDGLAQSRRCMDVQGHWTSWTAKNGVQGKIVVVRPDRYIFGVFSSVDEAAATMDDMLRPRKRPSPPKTEEL